MDEEDPSTPKHRPPAGPVTDGEGQDALAHLARQQADATWGDTAAARGVVPGIVSGDLGPKGRVSAQLRSLSRDQRASGSSVPRGTTTGRGGAALLAGMLLVSLSIFALVGLAAWMMLR